MPSTAIMQEIDAKESSPPFLSPQHASLHHVWEGRRRAVKQARRAAGALGFVGGSATSLTMLLAYYVARNITKPTPATAYDSYTMSPNEMGLPFEDVVFTSTGDTPLRGWWLHRQDAAYTVVACGGYRGRRADLLGISSALWRAGANVLVFDYRGHGESAGTPVTLGYHEVDDLRAAIDEAHHRTPGLPLGVIGYSMGASISIMAAAHDARVRAVVADSPFATQRSAVSRAVRRAIHVPDHLLLDAVDLLLGVVGGYHFDDVEPLRDVGLLAPRPLLLIHGLDDTVTDPHDSELLYEAAGEPKDLWLLPGVAHCGAYFADRQGYCRRVAAFFQEALREDIASTAV